MKIMFECESVQRTEPGKFRCVLQVLPAKTQSVIIDCCAALVPGHYYDLEIHGVFSCVAEGRTCSADIEGLTIVGCEERPLTPISHGDEIKYLEDRHKKKLPLR